MTLLEDISGQMSPHNVYKFARGSKGISIVPLTTNIYEAVSEVVDPHNFRLYDAGLVRRDETEVRWYGRDGNLRDMDIPKTGERRNTLNEGEKVGPNFRHKEGLLR